METSVKIELAGHILDAINEGRIDNANKDDWHFHLFNEDYYIVYYSEASNWLLRHHIDPFEAIGVCQRYEQEMFGEQNKVYDNSETTVNMLVYIYGEELLNEIDADDIDELKEACEEIFEE